jgi:hypothetical protein
MAISAAQKYLLNKMNSVAQRVQLGTLIETAEALGSGLVDASVTAAKLASDAVTTVKILNANVTLAKLAAGITPSHVIKYAGKYTTLGGNATEDATVAGVLATDIVVVTLQDKGGTPRTIVTAKPGTDKITLVFSGDPSTDHVVSYHVCRAAA